MRNDLQYWRDAWFLWLLVSSGAVAVGVVMEGPEVWHDIVQVLRRRSLIFRALFPRKEDTHGGEAKDWIRLTAFVGLIFVIVGVIGEGITESMVSDADGKLQSFDEAVLTETKSQTAQAFQRAADTEKEAAQENALAAKAEKEAQEENARAAKALESAEIARKEAEGFQLQIAQANERASQADQKAAEANRTAQQEQLARVRLEDTLSGWKLDAAAQARILEKIKPYSNTPFDLATNESEYAFMEKLDGMLHSAGWSRQAPKSDNPLGQFLIDGKSAVWLGSGMYVEFSATKAKEFTPAAEALVKALIAEGIPAKGHLVTSDPNPNAIHIVIGKRE